MQHLALIMDGNRRWAREKGITNPYNSKSMDAVRVASDFCLKNGIKHLSLYTFSLENFRRSKAEQELLFKLLVRTINDELPRFLDKGIRLRFIGDQSYFPPHVTPTIEQAQEKTKHLSTLNLNLLFCYGGQQEIAHATKAVAQKVKDGELEVGDIDHNVVHSMLWTTGIPDPDLIVRTSGVTRLSNFLIFQAAYSELAFLDCYWPELTESHLDQCLQDYEDSKRNFGA